MVPTNIVIIFFSFADVNFPDLYLWYFLFSLQRTDEAHLPPGAGKGKLNRNCLNMSLTTFILRMRTAGLPGVLRQRVPGPHPPRECPPRGGLPRPGCRPLRGAVPA